MLDKKQLEKDREKLVKQYQQLQTQLVRIEGAIAYISDNIKSLEEEDARNKTKKEA